MWSKAGELSGEEFKLSMYAPLMENISLVSYRYHIAVLSLFDFFFTGTGSLAVIFDLQVMQFLIIFNHFLNYWQNML